YIGVDIFLVISGYLITSIIVAGLNRGQFSFLDFYVRRFKRLMPALLVVLFTCLLVSLFLLLPDDLLNFSRSLRETLLLKSNFHFHNVTADYFAADSAEMPLLHTWSLAVEWQYYFVFPLFI